MSTEQKEQFYAKEISTNIRENFDNIIWDRVSCCDQLREREGRGGKTVIQRQKRRGCGNEERARDAEGEREGWRMRECWHHCSFYSHQEYKCYSISLHWPRALCHVFQTAVLLVWTETVNMFWTGFPFYRFLVLGTSLNLSIFHKSIKRHSLYSVQWKLSLVMFSKSFRSYSKNKLMYAALVCNVYILPHPPMFHALYSCHVTDKDTVKKARALNSTENKYVCV